MMMNPPNLNVRRAIQITKLFAQWPEITVDELETICSIQNYADIVIWIASNLPLSIETAFQLSIAIKEIDNGRD